MRFNQSMASRLGDKEKGITALSAKLEEQSLVISSLAQHITNVENSAEAPDADSGDYNREIRQLRDELLSKQAVVVELRQTLERERELSSSLTVEKDNQVDSLRAQLSEKDHRIEVLSSSLLNRLLGRYGQFKHNYLLPLAGKVTNRLSPVVDSSSLRVAIDTPVPRELAVGEGAGFYLAGWCYHAEQQIKQVQLLVNGLAHPVKAFGMAMPHVFASQYPELDPSGNSFLSGFWTIIPLPGTESSAQVRLVLHAILKNGTKASQSIGTIHLRNSDGFSTAIPEPSEQSSDALVAICMATCNPPLDLFARQIDSIRQQTQSNWTCIISDDASTPDVYAEILRIAGPDHRFRIIRSNSRQGFYRNFEKCLGMVPANAEFIALSDHDDYWHPDKLETLLREFDENTTLVYSDMNIVDREGKLISNTYWTTRPNNYTNFASLLMANTVTGAASVFRRSLLKYVLPFPQGVGDPYHDHWVACVALSCGEIKFVDRPLHDYVQHGRNVIGHCVPDPEDDTRKISAVLKDLPWSHNAGQRGDTHWRDVYFRDLLRIQLSCQTLLLRCRNLLSGSQKLDLERILTADESAGSGLWLWLRSLRARFVTNETVGSEIALTRAVNWKKHWALRTKLVQQQPEEGNFSPAQLVAPTMSAPATESMNSPGNSAIVHRIDDLRQKIAPLRLNISAAAPKRVNLLVPIIDLRYVFGGYITKFNLARRLAESGFQVRIVIVDECDYEPAVWKVQLQRFQGLERLFEYAETAYCFDRSTALEVGPQDVFIATTWWTAHIAHRAVTELSRERFVYLIQEYEPFTFPMGTHASLAEQTYQFPHYAIFSSELLRDYFRQNRLGVFAGDTVAAESNSISFQNAITDVGPVTVRDIANRHTRKLLFYARPEAHAARNMFETAVLALSRAVREGYFTDDWEFYGIGTIDNIGSIPLSSDVSLNLLPRQNQDTYRELLRSHDLGLSLMYTPHPSLVPIEMASAGMLVVTNTYANKTASRLNEISSNIIAVEPTVAGVAKGLQLAVANIDNYEARVQGANVNWAVSWEQTFNSAMWTMVESFVKSSASD